MKKILLTVIFVCLSIITFSLCVHADGNNETNTDTPNDLKKDSVTFDENDYKIFQCDESDTLIRIYNGFYMVGFANGATIEELTGNRYTLSEIYGVISENSSSIDAFMKLVDGKPVRITEPLKTCDIIPNKVFSYESVFSASNVVGLSEEIIVEEIYCLDGSSSANGLYIYYVTSKGDFVFFKQDVGIKEEYLLPLSEFYKFAAKVQEEITLNSDSDGIGVSSLDLQEIFYLSDYLLNKSEETPNTEMSETIDTTTEEQISEATELPIADNTENENFINSIFAIAVPIALIALVFVFVVITFLITTKRLKSD